MKQTINPVIEGMIKANMIKEAKASIALDGETHTFEEENIKRKTEEECKLSDIKCKDCGKFEIYTRGHLICPQCNWIGRQDDVETIFKLREELKQTKQDMLKDEINWIESLDKGMWNEKDFEERLMVLKSTLEKEK